MRSLWSICDRGETSAQGRRSVRDVAADRLHCYMDDRAEQCDVM